MGERMAEQIFWEREDCEEALVSLYDRTYHIREGRARQDVDRRGGAENRGGENQTMRKGSSETRNFSRRGQRRGRVK